MRTRNPHRLRELMLQRVNRVNQENERAQAERDTVTDFEMATAMVALGGGFASRLGQLWMFADGVNRAKILATWPTEVDQYRELARLKRAKVAKG